MPTSADESPEPLDEPRAAAAQSRPQWDTTVARAAAAALIVNSHMQGFYPARWLAEGGILGNILFFLVSGLGLGLSPRTGSAPFFAWYWKRLKRIYPAVWFCLIPLAVVLNGGWREWGPADYFGRLVWPIEGYHFLTRIIVYYILLYVVVRLGRLTWWLAATIVATLLMGWLFPPDWENINRFSTGVVSEPFKWSFYFSVVVAGAWIGRAVDPRRLTLAVVASTTAVLAAAYAGCKVTMVLRQQAVWLYPMFFYLTVALGISIVVLASHPKVISWLRRSGWVMASVSLIGAASLEIYLIHFQLLPLGMATSAPFPVNAVLFVAASIVLSILANRLLGRLTGGESARKEPIRAAATPPQQ